MTFEQQYYIVAVTVLLTAILIMWWTMSRTSSSRPDGPVLLAFITPHCPHCQACKGEVDRYSMQRKCRVIDVSNQSDKSGTALATKLGVQGVPSFFFQTGTNVFHAVPAEAPRTAATWTALAQKL